MLSEEFAPTHGNSALDRHSVCPARWIPNTSYKTCVHHKAKGEKSEFERLAREKTTRGE